MIRRSPSPLGVLIPAVLAVLTGTSASAESLADAWRMAEENDYRIEAAAADLDSARANEAAARAARLPTLSATGGYTRFNTAPQFEFPVGGSALRVPIFAGDDYSSAGAELKLPLYTGGRISKNIAAARRSAEGAENVERTERAALRLEVARTYIDVLRARRHLTIAESTVASLSAHASDVANMVERELVARSDLLAARVTEANAKQQRVRAENNAALAEATYNRRIGQPLARSPDLEATVPAVAIEAADSPEALIAEALQNRPEIRAYVTRAEALNLQSQAERAATRPQVVISGGYTYFDNEILDRRDFSMVGLGLSWSLFDGGQARNRSASLRAASRAAQSRADDLRTQIELEVRQAWLNVREARARVTAAAEAVAEADENLRISRELYGTGLGTNTQVLDAITLRVTATNNHDNATLDEVLALYELSYSAGRL